MNRLGIVMLATLLASCESGIDPPAGPSLAGPIVFTADLLASNEVPGVTGAEAAARGSVTITFDVPRDGSGEITGPGSATFAMHLTDFPPGTPAILAHIHAGSSGVPGPPVVNTGLSPAAPMLLADGTVRLSITVTTLTQAQARDIAASPAAYYFNVHTVRNPAGAVRGQLVRVR